MGVPKTSSFIPAIFAALVVSTSAFADCQPDIVSLKGDWGKASFSVEVADDALERARGLMHRESMPRFSGMLFIYERPQGLTFWMRNTLIPLDMLFVDQAGRVSRIHHNAIPLDETLIEGGDNLIATLEINGGLARKLGISEGSVLQHPDLPQNTALWPCGDS